jgi:hypothetical protein
MATSITKYKIFLASPSDLEDDRASIDEVINELNLTFGKQNEIVLELIKWETHSAPAISMSHPQKIISSDLGNDYDLFIGLIWTKFGTPTDENESGTEEEFLNAYEKFKKNPLSIQILFYFNNSAISPTNLNPEQLTKIQNFKSDIGKNKKVLYWEYQDTQQLNKFLRIHIPQRILELHKAENTLIKTTEINDTQETEIIEEEYGLFDYLEMIEEYTNDSTQSLLRISDATVWVGEQFNRKTNEINALTLNGNQPGRNVLKDVFKRTAKIMDNFGNRIEPEIPIFFDNFEKSIEAFSNLFNISIADFDTDEQEITEAKESLSYLISGIESSIISMENFLQSIRDFPRMSKELNKARTNVGLKLEKLLENLRISNSIALELQKSIT